jgi:hypothetical protein
MQSLSAFAFNLCLQRQRAQQSGQPAMSKRGKLFRFADMTEDNSWSPNQHT